MRLAAVPDEQGDRGRDEGDSDGAPEGPGEAGEGGEQAGRDVPPAEPGNQRPGRESGEQRLGVRHRLDDRDGGDRPQGRRDQARARGRDLRGEGVDPECGHAGADGTDEQPGVHRRKPRHARDDMLQPRVQREERVVGQRAPVRHRVDVAVAVLGDAAVPVRVPALQRPQPGAVHQQPGHEQRGQRDEPRGDVDAEDQRRGPGASSSGTTLEAGGPQRRRSAGPWCPPCSSTVSREWWVPHPE